jgi:hypothetical protein
MLLAKVEYLRAELTYMASIKSSPLVLADIRHMIAMCGQELGGRHPGIEHRSAAIEGNETDGLAGVVSDGESGC